MLIRRLSSLTLPLVLASLIGCSTTTTTHGPTQSQIIAASKTHVATEVAPTRISGGVASTRVSESYKAKVVRYEEKQKVVTKSPTMVCMDRTSEGMKAFYFIPPVNLIFIPMSVMMCSGQSDNDIWHEAETINTGERVNVREEETVLDQPYDKVVTISVLGQGGADGADMASEASQVRPNADGILRFSVADMLLELPRRPQSAEVHYQGDGLKAKHHLETEAIADMGLSSEKWDIAEDGYQLIVSEHAAGFYQALESRNRTEAASHLQKLRNASRYGDPSVYQHAQIDLQLYDVLDGLK